MCLSRLKLPALVIIWYSLFDYVWIKLYYITYSPNVPDPADRTLRKRAEIGQRIGTKLRMAQYVMIRLYYSVVRCSNKHLSSLLNVYYVLKKFYYVLINLYYFLIKLYYVLIKLYYVLVELYYALIKVHYFLIKFYMF